MTRKNRISAIAAIGNTTRALGKGGGLLWHIPEDMKRFKELTSGRPVIMGRKTWESIPLKFRPLPGRKNIVITRNADFEADGATVSSSIEDAIAKAEQANPEEIFIIGGAEIYRQALPLADRLYLTLVESDDPGDAFFPEYPEFKKEIERKEGSSGNLKFSFVTLER